MVSKRGVLGVGLVVATSAVLVSACNVPEQPRRTILGPAPTPVPIEDWRFSGLIVADDGSPVPGAVVSVRSDSGVGVAAETTSDVAGKYSFTVPKVSYYDVTAAHEGFEPSDVFFYRESLVDATLDILLHRVWRITAGDTVTVTFTSDDPYCYDESTMDIWACRRIRVVAAADGLLSVSVPPDPDTGNVLLQVADDDMGDSARTVTLPVDAGSETIVQILAFDRLPRTARLITELRPK